MAPLDNNSSAAANTRYVVSSRLFLRAPADNRLSLYRPSAGGSYSATKISDPAHLGKKYTCAAIDSDGGMVALGTSDGRVVVWNVDAGKLLGSFKATIGGSAVTDVAVHAGRVYTASSAASVHEWNVRRLSSEALSPSRTFKCGKHGSSAVAVSPDGKMLAVAATSVRVFDLDTGKRTHRFPGHQTPVSFISFFSDCCRFVTSSTSDRIIRVWNASGDASSDAPLHTFTVNGEVASVVVSPFADAVLACTKDWGISVWASLPASDPRPEPTRVLSKDILTGVRAASFVSSKDMVLVRETPSVVFERHSIAKEDADEDEADSKKRKREGLNGHASKEAEDAFEGTAVVHTMGARDVPVARPGRDAANGHDGVDGEEEENDGPRELALSFGQRLKSMEESQNQEEQDGGEESSRKRPRTTPSSLVTVLEQALQSGDSKMLNICLENRDRDLINNTVKRMSAPKVLQLLREVAAKFESRPSRGGSLLVWVDKIVTHHMAFLNSVPQTKAIIGSIRQTVEARLSVHKKVSKVAGKLEFIIDQITPAEDADENVGPKVVYTEEDDES